MEIRSVCILGGTGFVGRALAEQLAPAMVRMRIVTRSRPRAMALAVLPTAEIVVEDVHAPAALERCFEGMDAVVNLVGILHERGAQTFERCHVDLPAKVAQACRARGVRHLVHMSALGASAEGPSRYQRSKAAGEAALRSAAGILPVTILRPSVIFGPGDRFLNLFEALTRWFPLIPLAGARTRFQPIWVDDVARCLASVLGNRAAFNHTFELCGPKAYTLEELVRLVASITGRRRVVWPLPGPLATMQAFVLEHLPGKLMTRDNLASMAVDNTCATDFPAIFGFRPSSIEAVVPEYMAATTTRARYARFRNYAGR